MVALPSKTIHIGVVTVNRVTDHGKPDGRKTAPKNYLVESVSSLVGPGGLSKYRDGRVSISLFDSGSSDVSYIEPVADLFDSVHLSSNRITLCQNVVRALRVGVASGTDYVAVIQDDVLWYRGSFEFIYRWVASAEFRYAFLSVYPCYGTTQRGFYSGCVRVDPSNYWGSMAVLFKPRFAARCASFISERPGADKDDLKMAAWAGRNRLPIYTPAGKPRIGHIGDFSSLYEQKRRAYPGKIK